MSAARAAACSALLAMVALPRAAVADDRGGGDAVHGRFDGDVAVAAAAAVTVGPRGPRVGGDLRLRYLSTAGVFASYEEGELVGSGAEPRRLAAFGVEVRPLFLGRWATGTELGRPRLDLLIDSLGLEVGAFVAEPKPGGFGERAGLQLGLGAELPFFERIDGPFVGVHAGARWSEEALSGGPLRGASDRALFATLTLGWQVLFGGHVVDLGDRRPASRDRR